MTRRVAGVAMAGALLVAMLPGSAAAFDPPSRPVAPPSDAIGALKLDRPITLAGGDAAAKVDRALRAGSGQQRVVVRLSAPPAAAVVAFGATAQRALLAAARLQQDGVVTKARRLDSKVTVLGRTGRASNLVMLNMDASGLAALARDPAVISIKPVQDYQLDLSETVPYVGATRVQARGYTGAGVDVAILDSGIDYTHAAFGGPGTLDAFKAAYGDGPADARNTTLDGLFPTSRVKGGYDFVGEGWPGTDAAPVAEAPDPDPIDSPDAGTDLGIAYGTDGGHGTHVADIVGGTLGVAPGVNLFALKVCSSIAAECSGVALLQAVDWAMDPNGDGDLSDHVDIINLSIGSDYGTVADDDLTLAVERANSSTGILVVASAGNGGNKPYIAGTPAAAASAISVAQTQVPSARAYPLVITAPAGIKGTYANTEVVDWAPIGAGFTGDIVYVGGTGCPDGPDYPSDVTGRIALVDRGDCSVSLKTDRAAKAGAIAVLIGLVAPGDAISFSSGGGDTFVPTMVIQQSLSTAIKEALGSGAVSGSSTPASAISLVGSVAGSSSRGPSSANAIKPEIGAPGASVSAVSGSGTETRSFSGTSGAAPMVTGAAALLKGAFPGRNALEIKAVLMNTAETGVYTNPATSPGALAPITRIGGGELRVDRALASPLAIWDSSGKSAALSFGFVDGTKTVTLTRKLTLRNYSARIIDLKVTSQFRFANDKSNGAVRIGVPSTFRLKPGQTRTMTVTATIDASKLRDWTPDGGEAGIDPAPLDLMEYDGYINFDRLDTTADDKDPLHVAWQVLPRKSADVRLVGGSTVTLGDELLSGPLVGLPGGTRTLSNVGVGTAAVDVYSLVGTSPELPAAARGSNAPVIDLKSVGVQTWLVRSNTTCGATDSFLYRIAVSLWHRQTTAIVPGEIDVDIDVNGDGVPDYQVFSAPTSPGALDDGRAATYVYDYATDADPVAWFYTDHGTNDSNLILTFCGDQIGMGIADLGHPLAMTVTAYDWYYRDYAETDVIEGIEVAPYRERFAGMVNTSNGDIPGKSTATLTVADFGAADSNPSETGLLLILNAGRTSSKGVDYHGGAPAGREALPVTVLPAP
jgi:subtilisin family serine protease